MSMEKESSLQSTAVVRVETNVQTNSTDSSSVNSIQDTIAKSGNDCISVPSKEANMKKHKAENPRHKILFTRLDGTNYLSNEPSIKEILDKVTDPSECFEESTKILQLKESKDEEKRPSDTFTLHVSEGKYADLKKCNSPVNMAVILAKEKIGLSDNIPTNLCSSTALLKRQLLKELMQTSKDHSDSDTNGLAQLQILVKDILKAWARKYDGTFPVPLPMRNFRNSTPPIGPIRCRLKEEAYSTPGSYRLHLGNVAPYPRKKRCPYWRKSSKKAASGATVLNGFPHQASPEVEANVFKDSDTATATPHCSSQVALQQKGKGLCSQSLHLLKAIITPSSTCVPAGISSSKESSVLERPLFDSSSMMTFTELARPRRPYPLLFDVHLLSWKRDFYCG